MYYHKPFMLCVAYDISTASPTVNAYINGAAVTWSSQTNTSLGTTPTITAFYGDFTTSYQGMVRWGSLYSSGVISQSQALALSKKFNMHSIPDATTGQSFTYARASDHYCTNSAESVLTKLTSDVPCLNADGVDGRVGNTNLLPFSTVSDEYAAALAANWSNAGATLAFPSTDTSPIGTADITQVASTTSASSVIYQDVAVSAGTYTLSCFMKSDAGASARIFIGNRFSSTPLTYCNHTLTSTWSRKSCTVTTASAITLSPVIAGGLWDLPITTPYPSNPVATVGGTIQLWACQLEASDVAGPFRSVFNTAVSTSVAPTLTFSTTTAPRPLEMSSTVKIASQPTAASRLYEFGDASNYVAQFASGAAAPTQTPRCELYDGSTKKATAAAYTFNAAALVKCLYPVTATAMSSCLNGSCATGDSLGSTPSQIVGSGTVFSGSAGGNVNAYIKNLCIGGAGACP